MKKFLSLAFVVVLFSGLTSCALFEDKIIPNAKVKAAEGIVKAIVKTGECKAVDMVKADVDNLLKIESTDSMVVKALEKANEAPADAQSEGVVSDICKAAASLAIPALLHKGVPEKWECTLTDLSGKIGALASEACGKI